MLMINERSWLMSAEKAYDSDALCFDNNDDDNVRKE